MPKSGTYALLKKLGRLVEIVPYGHKDDAIAAADHWCNVNRRYGPPYPKYAVVWIDYPDEIDWRG